MPLLPPGANPVDCKTHFAVELLPRPLKQKRETTKDVAFTVLKLAEELGVRCRRLGVLDVIEFASASFVRMQTDAPDVSALADRLLKEGRGVINVQEGPYIVRLSNGRVGKTSFLVMHGLPKPGQSDLYYGNQLRDWEKQFQS